MQIAQLRVIRESIKDLFFVTLCDGPKLLFHYDLSNSVMVSSFEL